MCPGRPHTPHLPQNPAVSPWFCSVSGIDLPQTAVAPTLVALHFLRFLRIAHEAITPAIYDDFTYRPASYTL